MKYFLTIIHFLCIIHIISGQENTALLCSDGIDNDGDGAIDCDDSDCILFSDDGCSTCFNGLSFADSLISYSSGCPLIDPFPEGALGLNDYAGGTVDGPDFVFLGQGGYIELAFTNNFITNSGDSNPDLYVFEVGPNIEAMEIHLKPGNLTSQDILRNLTLDEDPDGYFNFGVLPGPEASFDIDKDLQGTAQNALLFNAIKIYDVDDIPCGTTVVPGADIDAVCGINMTDCLGVLNGTAIIDECGECLQPDDPNFNQSCTDCLGAINGIAVLDDCGECLPLNDPDFNQSCSDCEGTPNGTAVIDNCGECLQPDNPDFNQCFDCNGVLNGTAIFDECGICLEPNDPDFNQACSDCLGTPNGTAIMDACGECLEPNDPAFNQSCTDCDGTPNGNAILDDCGECLQPNDPSFNTTCLDCAGTINGTAIVDECGSCLEPADPDFNQVCSDCLGTPNGTAIIDACGNCIDPNSPSFNQACTDCNGIVNGTAILDDCEECLEPDDPNFNQSCTDCGIYIPNVFTPNSDDLNDQFKIYTCPEKPAFVNTLHIFDRWGNIVYRAEDFTIGDPDIGWNGRTLNEQNIPGVYVYHVQITNLKEKTIYLRGEVTLIR